jgi:hypothetical protein
MAKRETVFDNSDVLWEQVFDAATAVSLPCQGFPDVNGQVAVALAQLK